MARDDSSSAEETGSPFAAEKRWPKLRWTRNVACAIAGLSTLVLLFLGVRSTHTYDHLYILCNTTGYDGLGDRLQFSSNRGQLTVAHHYGHRGSKFLMLASGESYPNIASRFRGEREQSLNPYWFSSINHWAIGMTEYAVPTWLAALAMGSLWAVLVRTWRFGLRTFLIGSVLFSLLLASALAELRYPFTMFGDWISRPE